MKNSFFLMMLVLFFQSPIKAKIDSISLTGYSNGTFTILLNNKANIQVAKMQYQFASLGYLPIINGFTKASIADNTKTQAVFDLVNELIESKEIYKYIEKSGNRYMTHTSRAILKLYSKGNEEINYGFYEHDILSDSLQMLYDQIRQLTASKNMKRWDSADLNVKLIDETNIDSILIIKIAKNPNGIGRIQTTRSLSEPDINYLVEKLNTCKKVNPLKNGSFIHKDELMPNYVVKMYLEKRKKYLSFDGRYFRKEFYLWFKADRRIRKIICD